MLGLNLFLSKAPRTRRIKTDSGFGFSMSGFWEKPVVKIWLKWRNDGEGYLKKIRERLYKIKLEWQKS